MSRASAEGYFKSKQAVTHKDSVPDFNVMSNMATHSPFVLGPAEALKRKSMYQAQANWPLQRSPPTSNSRSNFLTFSDSTFCSTVRECLICKDTEGRDGQRRTLSDRGGGIGHGDERNHDKLKCKRRTGTKRFSIQISSYISQQLKSTGEQAESISTVWQFC